MLPGLISPFAYSDAVSNSIAQKCLQMVSTCGSHALCIPRVFGSDEKIQAMEAALDGMRLESTLIAMPHNPSMVEMGSFRASETLRLSPDVCYLLVGGLGGLGRAVSSWMVEQGARHLMFLSRSAREDDDTAAFFEDLRSRDCAVETFCGNVAALEDVMNAVRVAAKPIGGVMQMSAVLRVSILHHNCCTS